MYEYVDSHTGDLQILACGKSFEDALHDLTLGVIEFLFDRSSIKGRERFRFEVEADDLHELVINFFEEILFIFDTEHFVFSDVNIEEFSQGDRYKIVAELIGEKSSGRLQDRNRYLYWELGAQRAVRKGYWKAVRPGKNRRWELFNLRTDISERKNLANQEPEILKELAAFAERAHEPVREGVYWDRSLEEKDRRAKWGGRPAPRRNRKARRIGKSKKAR